MTVTSVAWLYCGLLEMRERKYRVREREREREGRRKREEEGGGRSPDQLFSDSRG